MRTQSVDTNPDTERVLVELIRAASIQKRFRLVQGMTQGSIWGKVHLGQKNYHVSSEREAAIRYSSLAYGPEAVESVRAALQDQENWQIQPIDFLVAIEPALQTFARLDIFVYIGGSLASSLHGMQQLAQDIDLVIDLPDLIPAQLLTTLRTQYAFNEATVVQALQQRTSFTLIDTKTLLKIDVVVPHMGAFDQEMRQLVVPYVLDEHHAPLLLASAPEMILLKLRRYQQYALTMHNGMEDDATWNDMLGMLKVQAPTLDYALLDRWANELGFSELLTRALMDAGHLPETPEYKQTRKRFSVW